MNKINNLQFLLDTTFNRYTPKEYGDVIYWRDCILQSDMQHGEQGYIWIYSDGEVHHSYRTPEQVFG